MILPPQFSADFQTIYEALKPLTNQAYFVGGAVRDSLLGREICDLDIEVYGIAPDRFAKLMGELGAHGVGQSFFVYKLGKFDLSLPRRELKLGVGHRGFEVEWENDPRKASARRDFTINAMMINIFTLELFDFHGGRDDLAAKRIRHIDDRAFIEDSLRVLRAARFAARFGFTIAEQTVALCQTLAIDDLSKERIWGECEKIFASPEAVKGLYFMIKLGVARQLWGRDDAPLSLFRALKRVKLGYADRTVGFLYALRCSWHLPIAQLCGSVGAPKAIARSLRAMPSAPKRVSDRFLIAVSLKMALKNWAGTTILGLENEAKRLGVFDRAFEPIRAKELFEEGYTQGYELGRELRARTLAKTKEYGKSLSTADRNRRSHGTNSRD
ncbi:multifunctional CCA protein [Campylobacterota bacterium]|nr:multifunctional CCA protein [Campylobacterota bacterium]